MTMDERVCSIEMVQTILGGGSQMVDGKLWRTRAARAAPPVLADIPANVECSHASADVIVEDDAET